MISQIEFSLAPKERGIHLITNEVLKNIGSLPEKGIANIFIKHTSAALTINENADPSVRIDMNNYLDKYVPENESYFVHTMEGADDMPAHIKASLFGSSLTIPITNGKFNMGTWQGIYLCEFRNYGGNRKIVATIYE
jgi:secondary thiamine-phosphate synthase enzyme